MWTTLKLFILKCKRAVRKTWKMLLSALSALSLYGRLQCWDDCRHEHTLRVRISWAGRDPQGLLNPAPGPALDSPKNHIMCLRALNKHLSSGRLCAIWMIQKGIRAWSELQVVALFLPGKFMRRYLSPLVAGLVFLVVPHWLSGYLPACFVPKSCICGESKGWTERGVWNQFKDATPEKHLIFVQICECQYCSLHNRGTLALLSQTPCSCWDGVQMPFFTVISTGISLLCTFQRCCVCEGWGDEQLTCCLWGSQGRR